MATKKYRVVVALEPGLYANVTSFANTNGTTRSVAARDLIRLGVESIEDTGLMALIAQREASAKSRRWLSHREVWR